MITRILGCTGCWFIDGLNYSKTIIQKHPEKSPTPHQKSSNNIL